MENINEYLNFALLIIGGLLSLDVAVLALISIYVKFTKSTDDDAWYAKFKARHDVVVDKFKGILASIAKK